MRKRFAEYKYQNITRWQLFREQANTFKCGKRCFLSPVIHHLDLPSLLPVRLHFQISFCIAPHIFESFVRIGIILALKKSCLFKSVSLSLSLAPSDTHTHKRANARLSFVEITGFLFNCLHFTIYCLFINFHIYFEHSMITIFCSFSLSS